MDMQGGKWLKWLDGFKKKIDKAIRTTLQRYSLSIINGFPSYDRTLDRTVSILISNYIDKIKTKRNKI